LRYIEEAIQAKLVELSEYPDIVVENIEIKQMNWDIVSKFYKNYIDINHSEHFYPFYAYITGYRDTSIKQNYANEIEGEKHA
jgi:hypothetical protein